LHRFPPAVVLAGSFALAIVAGTALLSLPVAQAGEPVSLVDALFTSTSAVCVTGLTVVDTGTRFSPFGQAVVLALIQVGGLGLMTFAVFVGVVLGRKVAFTDRMVIQDSMHHTPKAGVRRLVRYVLTFTLAVEAAGASSRPARPSGRASFTPSPPSATPASVSCPTTSSATGATSS
jgi:trk system potassium uptake protein